MDISLSLNHQALQSSIAAKPRIPANYSPKETTAQPQPASHNQTSLIEDNNLSGDSSRRRTRIFEQPDGRRFTRVEDLTLTANGARRTVIQQNPSGAITQYEEILDRDSSGAFRRTQRFKDESGEETTRITQNYKVTDAFILSGGTLGMPSNENDAPKTLRGGTIDLTA